MWEQLHQPDSVVDMILEGKSAKGNVEIPAQHKQFKQFREREIQDLTKKYVQPAANLYEVRQPIFFEEDGLIWLLRPIRYREKTRKWIL